MIQKRFITLVLALVVLMSTAASAQVVVVNAEQVKASLKGKKKVVLIDTRSPEEYMQSHIPGAIVIPAERMPMEIAKLPRDKSVPLIFYCRGTG